MRKIIVAVLGIALTVGIAAYWLHYTAAPREEGLARLNTVRVKPFANFIGHIAASANAQNTRPSELLDLPKGITENAMELRYYHVPVGQHNVFVLVQYLSNDRARAWVDTRMNNRLSDEAALNGSAKKHVESNSFTLNYYDFGTVRLSGEHATSCDFRLIGIERHYLTIRPVSYRTGTLRLDNKLYRVAVFDGDYDGAFHTYYNPSEYQQYWASDAFILDIFTRSLLNRNQLDTGKMVPLGRYFKFNPNNYIPISPEKSTSRYYTVSISSDGNTFRMTPAEPAMGTLKIGNNVRFSSQLLSDAAAQSVNFRDQILLPAGRYQMRWNSATLTFTDPNGVDSQLRADFRNALRKGLFEIIEGQTTTLNPGPPFTIKTDVVKRGDEQLSINAGLVGNEGETYGLRLKQWAGRPELKILAENGDILHTGSMEYG